MARPAKYRKTEEIQALRLDAESGAIVADWTSGKYIPDKVQVLIPIFHEDNTVTSVEVNAGEYVVKKEDGALAVWSEEEFSNSGFKPFHHRSPRGERPDNS